MKNFYTDVNLEERTLELILVSSDRSAEEWKRHHAVMPWYSIRFDDARAHELRDKYQVYAVPTLIILDAATGFTVTTTARKDLNKPVAETYESWAKLLDLKRVRAVERAEQDAISKALRAEREWKDKQKKEQERLAAEAA